MPKAVLSDRGVLVVSIDLEWPLAQLHVREGRELESVAGRLFQMFGGAKVPATWAVADPVHSAATDRIRNLPGPHEIAIFGDAAWVGCQAGRRRFAQELSRRVVGARAVGIDVTTLVTPAAPVREHLDLVIKQNITALRGPGELFGREQMSNAPQALHFGLWEIPGSARLPRAARWLPLGAGRTIRRALDRVAATGGLFHLVVDAPRFSQAARTALKSLERTVRHAARRRDQGCLEILTLAEIAARISQVDGAEPTQSILRKAG